MRIGDVHSQSDAVIVGVKNQLGLVAEVSLDRRGTTGLDVAVDVDRVGHVIAKHHALVELGIIQDVHLVQHSVIGNSQVTRHRHLASVLRPRAKHEDLSTIRDF